MILAIFDVDGTLTDTTVVDSECYPRAWEQAFGARVENISLEEFTHVTDSGITLSLFQRLFGRAPEPGEVQNLIARYIGLLEETYKIKPHLFGEIEGAGRILRRLMEESGFAVAVATGAWSASARYKLERAEIDIAGLPFCTADDYLAREDIILNSISRARTHYGVSDFSSVVSIGDGVWDIRTAARLGLPFIGVGQPEKLLGLGAMHAVRDYSLAEDFIQLIERAVKTGPPSLSSPSR